MIVSALLVDNYPVAIGKRDNYRYKSRWPVHDSHKTMGALATPGYSYARCGFKNQVGGSAAGIRHECIGRIYISF